MKPPAPPDMIKGSLERLLEDTVRGQQSGPPSAEGTHEAGLAKRIDACEDILSTLHNLRQRLRHEKNTISSQISKLPSELLLIVFELAARPGLHYYKDLTNFRLVTLPWAKVIEDYPPLWRFAHCTDSPQRTRLALYRSKALPLHVRLLCAEASVEQIAIKHHDHSKWSAPFLNLRLTREVGRWESLTVKCKSGSSGLDPFLQAVPPNIKKCSITLKSDQPEHRSGTLFSPRNGVSPQLESLYLDGFVPVWASTVLINLRTLAIHNFPRYSCSLPQLTTAIAACPILESLEIVNCAIPAPPTAPHESRTFVPTILPNLKRMILAEAPSFIIAHILSHFETPLIISFQIRMNHHADADVGSEHQPTHVETLANIFQSLRHLIPLFGGDISTDAEFTPMVRMNRQQLGLEFGRDGAFRVAIMGRYLERDFQEWIGLVGEAASYIRTATSLRLHLAAYATFDEEFTPLLIAMDAYFPSVTKLTFIDRCGPPSQFGAPIQGQSRWLFPALTHLCISVDASNEVFWNIITIAKARQEAAGSEPPSRLQRMELHGKWSDAEVVDIQSRTGIATSMVSHWSGPDHQ